MEKEDEPSRAQVHTSMWNGALAAVGRPDLSLFSQILGRPRSGPETQAKINPGASLPLSRPGASLLAVPFNSSTPVRLENNAPLRAPLCASLHAVPTLAGIRAKAATKKGETSTHQYRQGGPSAERTTPRGVADVDIERS